MRHQETGDTHWFPDNPGVVADQESRGWQVADPPPGSSQGPGRVAGSRRERKGNPGPGRWGRPATETMDILALVCTRDGIPDHGEQVLARFGRDASAGESREVTTSGPSGGMRFTRPSGEGVFLLGAMWTQTAKGPIVAAKCPKCRTDLQLSHAKATELFEALAGSDLPPPWRWDINRRCPLLK